MGIYERVEEAINFRKELNKLEISEKERVNMLKKNSIEQQFYELECKHAKEEKLLQLRLATQKNKLAI